MTTCRHTCPSVYLLLSLLLASVLEISLPTAVAQAPDTGMSPSGSAESIQATALLVARKAWTPKLVQDQNLSQRAVDLALYAKLLAGAQHFQEALRSIELAGEPKGVQPQALAEVAKVYLHAGRSAESCKIVSRIVELNDWSLGPALLSIVRAELDLQHPAEALRIARMIRRPEERFQAFLELAQQHASGQKKVGVIPLLKEAQAAAIEMHPLMAPDFFHSTRGRIAHVSDYTAVMEALVQISRLYAQIGAYVGVNQVCSKIGTVLDPKSELFQTDALNIMAGMQVERLQFKAARQSVIRAERLMVDYYPQTVGQTEMQVRLLLELAKNAKVVGHAEIAKSALSRAEERAQGLGAITDPAIGAEYGAMALLMLAQWHFEAGDKVNAARLLQSARELIATACGSPKMLDTTLIPPQCSPLHPEDRVTVLTHFASAFHFMDQLSASDQAIAQAVAETLNISTRRDEEWKRSAAWKEIAQVFTNKSLTVQALDALLSKGAPEPAMTEALLNIADQALLQRDYQLAKRIIDLIPQCYGKVLRSLDLLREFEKEGRMQESQALLLSLLKSVVSKHDGWETWLLLIATIYPHADRPAEGVLRDVLREIVN